MSLLVCTCHKCGHVLCIDCVHTEWGIIQIQGAICCKCGEQASLEVWRSGKVKE